jgi:hypothetical protein
MKKQLKYIVASLGAVFIFASVFLLWGIIVNPLLPPVFNAYVHVGEFGTNNWLGAILGLIAASLSFRATLRKQK